MNTDKQRIYNGDWKTLHPYSGSAPTDLYYITLANKVLAAIRAVETSLDESDYRKIDETEQKELALHPHGLFRGYYFTNRYFSSLHSHSR